MHFDYLNQVMDKNIVYQDISAVDALWTIYQQQNEWVRKTFLARVNKSDGDDEMPYMRTREDMMKISRERMRDIIAGQEPTLSNDEVMRLVNDAIAVNV